MDLYLKAPGDGHVIGFTLPLHPTIDRQWRDGILFRVNADGSPYADGPFAEPPAAGGTVSGSGEPTPGDEDYDAGGFLPGGATSIVSGPVSHPEFVLPPRPADNAPKAEWAAYAEGLGLDPAGKTRAQLVELTTPPEMRPGA